MNQFALPYNENFPAVPAKRSLVAKVALTVRCQLWKPEFQSRLGEPSQAAFWIRVTMEEAAMHEYDLAPSWKH
jgi:hypothetical protein